MSDVIDTWRAALKDESSPRYRAAWLLFVGEFDAAYAAKQLADVRDQVVEWLFEILDTPELYEANSLGKGKAAEHAAELLGEWQVDAALPRLMQILEETELDNPIHAAAGDGLAKMGDIVVDPLLDLDKRVADEIKHVTIASIIADAAPEDPRVFPHATALYRRLKSELALVFMTEQLVTKYPAKMIPLIEESLRKMKLSSAAQRRMQSALAEAHQLAKG